MLFSIMAIIMFVGLFQWAFIDKESGKKTLTWVVILAGVWLVLALITALFIAFNV